MHRIILTIEQARSLQREHTAAQLDPANTWKWPGMWAFLEDVTVPERPNNVADKARVAAGVRMMEMGCSDEQVALQLMWKQDGPALERCKRQYRRDNKDA